MAEELELRSYEIRLLNLQKCLQCLHWSFLIDRRFPSLSTPACSAFAGTGYLPVEAG